MSVSDTLINTLFDGRYRILRKLGSGGMANVYLAEDEDLGRRVAIKILNERYSNDDLFVERFRREAKSAAALSHPNIVSIYDRGEAEGHPYIAMEVIEGRSLKELILTRGPLPIDRAVGYAQQILSALRFAHRGGIIHRDIKPHNILLGQEDRLKVTDFGIARSGPSQMTEVGSIMGTAHYLSPEQARDSAAVAAASDLYSVGVVLYEMLTGKVPFTGDSAVEVALKHANEPPRPPSQVNPDVPPELDQIVLRALAKNPADRYQSAEEFAEDLKRVEAGLPVSPETAEAATILLGAPTTAATQVLTGGSQTRVAQATRAAPPRRPPAYPPPPYGYEEPPRRRRRRTVFPWLLVLGLLAAAGFAGWYVYQQVQDELRETAPVAVPNVVGIQEELAVAKVEEAGLQAEVVREPSREQPAGKVFDQDPDAGRRIAQDEVVTIHVSSGVPKVDVPRLAGRTYEEAVAALEDVNLEAERRDVFSENRQPGIVTSQDPKPGENVEEGSTVIVRVSRGRENFAVPDVLNQSQESAVAELEEAGFEVSVQTTPADTEPGLVIGQNPDPGAEVPKESTVTITVSEGPGTAPVPGVTGFDRASAESELGAQGFSVSVQEQETLDPTQDGIVLAQDPPAGTELEPGSTVTIVVGVLVAPPEGEVGEGEVIG